MILMVWQKGLRVGLSAKPLILRSNFDLDQEVPAVVLGCCRCIPRFISVRKLVRPSRHLALLPAAHEPWLRQQPAAGAEQARSVGGGRASTARLELRRLILPDLTR